MQKETLPPGECNSIYICKMTFDNYDLSIKHVICAIVYFIFVFYYYLCFLQDAHNCILEFDEETAMFAVYDGHGGNTLCRFCLVVQHALHNVAEPLSDLPLPPKTQVWGQRSNSFILEVFLSLSIVVSQPPHRFEHTPTLRMSFNLPFSFRWRGGSVLFKVPSRDHQGAENLQRWQTAKGDQRSIVRVW